MKTRLRPLCIVPALLALSTFNAQLSIAHAQGTAFTYQGRLNNGDGPVNGSYDLTFTLFVTNSSGVAIAGPVTNSAAAVSNGLFTATIDFGPGVFTGTSNWLEIAVRTNGNGSFTTLAPRQPLTPTPDAIYAEGAGNLRGTLSAAQLTSIGNTNNPAIGNFFVGPSGNPTTSGEYNTADGVLALSNNATGYNNTANGALALNANTGGHDNTATGAGALFFNTIGNYNTASGVFALEKNTSGNNNVASGYQALNANTNGSYNTAEGYGALYGNISGSFNTAVGVASLSALGFNNGAGGGNNIALGYGAGDAYNANESSNIDLGSEGIAGENNTIHIGSGQTQTYIAGVINGNGGGLTDLSASQLTGDAQQNVFVGSSIISVTTGTANTADGYLSLPFNTSGFQNSAYGTGSLANNTTGNHNTAIGYDALFHGTNASLNTANGGLALSSLLDGTNNIALGYLAGSAFAGNESSNIDIGNIGVASENNTIRIGTPGVQTQAFLAGVINGNGGGLTNLSAARLTGALPAISGASLTSLPANAALLGASQSFTGGNTFTSTMTVTNPGAVNSLNVYGTQTGGWPNPVAFFENKSTAATASPALRVVCDSGTNQDGALSVSVSTGANGLIAEFGNSTAFVVRITNNGSIFAAGNVYANGVLLTSDRNAKEHFKLVDNQVVLAKVAALPVTQWNYKLDPADVQHIGPMAQDFQAAFQLDGADDKHISVVDEGGVALAAIQGLNQKLEQKETEITELKTRLEKLEQLVSRQNRDAK